MTPNGREWAIWYRYNNGHGCWQRSLDEGMTWHDVVITGLVSTNLLRDEEIEEP